MKILFLVVGHDIVFFNSEIPGGRDDWFQLPLYGIRLAYVHANLDCHGRITIAVNSNEVYLLSFFSGQIIMNPVPSLIKVDKDQVFKWP
jgi:hypothetical protein